MKTRTAPSCRLRRISNRSRSAAADRTSASLRASLAGRSTSAQRVAKPKFRKLKSLKRLKPPQRLQKQSRKRLLQQKRNRLNNSNIKVFSGAAIVGPAVFCRSKNHHAAVFCAPANAW